MTRRLSPAAYFAKWRWRTRLCLVAGAGIVLVAQHPQVARYDLPRRVMLTIGLTLLAATFILYSRYCNRCPRCGTSFSRAPEYQSSETNGLALFGGIERCPFCSEPLTDK